MLKHSARKQAGGLAVGAFTAVALFARACNQPRRFGTFRWTILAPGRRRASRRRMMVLGDSTFAPAMIVATAAKVAFARTAASRGKMAS